MCVGGGGEVLPNQIDMVKVLIQFLLKLQSKSLFWEMLISLIAALFRSFQYVSDLVNGLVALMESNYSKPVNIGNPDERSIITFAKEIK